jgi:NADH dehydrogenase
LRTLLRGQPNVRVLLGNVERVDLNRRIVGTVGSGEVEVPYDTLIVAAGATHSYFGHDHWVEFAPRMETLDDAVRLRSRILLAFEMAEQEADPVRRAAWLTFAVVGGGPILRELGVTQRASIDGVRPPADVLAAP